MTSRHRMPSTFRITDWDPTARCFISAIGATPADCLTAGLAGVLAAVSPSRRSGSATGATVSVPIRADGRDLTEIFEGLVAVLVDEICEASIEFSSIRIDGVLRTERGLTAWGYATGRRLRHKPPAACDVASATVASLDGHGVELRCVLARESLAR
jgi:hypothetical protein